MNTALIEFDFSQDWNPPPPPPTPGTPWLSTRLVNRIQWGALRGLAILFLMGSLNAGR